MKNFAASFLLACGIAAATAQDQSQPAPVLPAEQQQQVDPAQVPADQAQQVPQPQQIPQAQPAQPAQPPQPQHVVLRVVGSQVRNHAGERLGLIEEILVSRANGAIDYAIVSPQYPTNSARQVPVPWRVLSHAWDQSRAGGPAGANQVFILNIDSKRLATAPVLDRSRPATADQTLANAGNFFGQPVGATGTAAGTVTGGTGATPVIDQGTATTAPVGGVVVPGDNQVIVPGQRSGVQPGGDNRVPPPEERVLHPQSPNAPAQGSGTGTRGTGSSGTGTGGTGGGGPSGGGTSGR